MFEADIYIQRRQRLKEQVNSGVALFLGNEESSMNYPDNHYSFRQDSSFLYFWGLDYANLYAIIDFDEGKEIVFGNDLTMDEIIWMGEKPTLGERCEKAGVTATERGNDIESFIKKAVGQGRTMHFLPQYRPDNVLKIQRWLGVDPRKIEEHVSVPLIKAVAAQRSIKSKEEITQIEAALDISYEIHTMAMAQSTPGKYEREIVGMMEGLVYACGGRMAFPIIFSIHGETLHNTYHGNILKKGDIVVNDSGAESAMHYASDITRTIPVGGKFSDRQKEIYGIVLNSLEKMIGVSKPGLEFRQAHTAACRELAVGLKELGLMKGDPEEAVEAGAHALFFQCGAGHMMGLDVHDMEGLGEQYVGYTDTIVRNPQFGICSLRLAKPLEPGFVVTVEPGIYFIPELINRWSAEKKLAQYINYDAVEKYRDFGGVRIEDNILITGDGNRLLGKPIPKRIEDVEAMASSN